MAHHAARRRSSVSGIYVKTGKPDYSAPALEKGLDIIELLSEHAEGLTLAELGKRLGRTTAEIFRMVVTLQSRGYLRTVGDRYVLSLLLFQLAHRHQPVRSLASTALPLMTQLANDVSQSFHMCVYQGGRVLIIVVVESPERWGFSLKVGTSIGLADTASGLVLLAFQDDAARRKMIEQHVLVEGEPPLDSDRLSRELDEIRRRGFSRMASRQIRGVKNLAYPVFGRNGHAIATLTTPYLERIDNAPTPSIAEVGASMKAAASELTTLLGLNVYWEPVGKLE